MAVCSLVPAGEASSDALPNLGAMSRVPSRIELLELDGFSESDCDALFAGGWLETDSQGRVWIHDWDEHQRAYDENTTRAYEAARKADWRNRAAAGCV